MKFSSLVFEIWWSRTDRLDYRMPPGPFFNSRGCIKITVNFSDNIRFLHAFYLKFTINATIMYIPVEMTFSMSMICHNYHGQYFSSWSIALKMINISDLLTIQLLWQSTRHWKIKWIEVLTIHWRVFWLDKLPYVKVQVSNCMTWMVHWQQLCYLTSSCLQRIFNQ